MMCRSRSPRVHLWCVLAMEFLVFVPMVVVANSLLPVGPHAVSTSDSHDPHTWMHIVVDDDADEQTTAMLNEWHQQDIDTVPTGTNALVGAITKLRPDGSPQGPCDHLHDLMAKFEKHRQTVVESQSTLFDSLQLERVALRQVEMQYQDAITKRETEFCAQQDHATLCEWHATDIYGTNEMVKSFKVLRPLSSVSKSHTDLEADPIVQTLRKRRDALRQRVSQLKQELKTSIHIIDPNSHQSKNLIELIQVCSNVASKRRENHKVTMKHLHVFVQNRSDVEELAANIVKASIYPSHSSSRLGSQADSSHAGSETRRHELAGDFDSYSRTVTNRLAWKRRIRRLQHAIQQERERRVVQGSKHDSHGAARVVDVSDVTIEPHISFCMTLLNHLEPLTTTLQQTLEIIQQLNKEKASNDAGLRKGPPMAELVIVLFDTGNEQSERTHRYIMDIGSNALADGDLRYYRSTELKEWHTAAAKNTVHRLAKGTLLYNFDCNAVLRMEELRFLLLKVETMRQHRLQLQVQHSLNRDVTQLEGHGVHAGAPSVVNDHLRHPMGGFWYWAFSGDHSDGSYSRIAVPRSVFTFLRGYDEAIQMPGREDMDYVGPTSDSPSATDCDFIMRLQQYGLDPIMPDDTVGKIQVVKRELADISDFGNTMDTEIDDGMDPTVNLDAYWTLLSSEMKQRRRQQRRRTFLVRNRFQKQIGVNVKLVRGGVTNDTDGTHVHRDVHVSPSRTSTHEGTIMSKGESQSTSRPGNKDEL